MNQFIRIHIQFFQGFIIFLSNQSASLSLFPISISILQQSKFNNQMEVRVKYEIVSKSTLSFISYNHHFSILALVANGNDTATFFSVARELALTPKFQMESRPSSQGCIRWSPSGKLIAVGNVKVQLWKFEYNKLSPIRDINEGFIQIINIQWSQDSQYYLCYGINHRDSPLSINIRNIQTNQLRQIITPDRSILASFDPFGKFIAVLTLRNTLDLYNCQTLAKAKSINLADTKSDPQTLKDKRFGDWSPQYSFFACPNLNDARIPTAIIFDRNRNFSTKQILLGHQSTITCLRFSPHIYQFQSQLTFILAVGDSSGCLSVWRIGKLRIFNEPLFIMSSQDRAQQSIQGIEWNTEGDTLFLNVLKRYLILVGLKSTDFGKKLSQSEKNNLIIATYGVSGARQIQGARLEVFGEYCDENQQQIQLQNTVKQQQSFIEQPKQIFIKTKQQVIYTKDKNNRQRKKIVLTKIGDCQNKNLENKPTESVQSFQNGDKWFPQKAVAPPLKLSPLKLDIKKQYLLPNGNALLTEVVKSVTILSIKLLQLAPNLHFSKRSFTNQINNLIITKKNILILSNEKLYVFDFNLQLIDLPCHIGQASSFCCNNSGTIYYMTTNGTIRGFNYITHSYLTETSAAYLLLSESSEVTVNPFISFSVYDNDNDRLHVQLRRNNEWFFYCKQTKTWRQFRFQDGFYVPGHSLRITRVDKQIANNFYQNLISPCLKPNIVKNQSVANQYEIQAVYYKKYLKNDDKLKESILKLLIDLKNKGNDDELRKQIKRYFIDQTSADHLGDWQLWQKVKKIGGKIIEEFMIMQTI